MSPPYGAIPAGSYAYAQGVRGGPSFVPSSPSMASVPASVRQAALSLASAYAAASMNGGNGTNPPTTALSNGWYLALGNGPATPGMYTSTVSVWSPGPILRATFAQPNMDVSLVRGRAYRLSPANTGGNPFWKPSGSLFVWNGVTGASGISAVPAGVVITPSATNTLSGVPMRTEQPIVGTLAGLPQGLGYPGYVQGNYWWTGSAWYVWDGAEWIPTASLLPIGKYGQGNQPGSQQGVAPVTYVSGGYSGPGYAQGGGGQQGQQYGGGYAGYNGQNLLPTGYYGQGNQPGSQQGVGPVTYVSGGYDGSGYAAGYGGSLGPVNSGLFGALPQGVGHFAPAPGRLGQDPYQLPGAVYGQVNQPPGQDVPVAPPRGYAPPTHAHPYHPGYEWDGTKYVKALSGTINGPTGYFAGLPHQGVGQSGTVPAAGSPVTGGTTQPGNPFPATASGPANDGTAVNALGVLLTSPNQSACVANPAIQAFQASYNVAFGGNLPVDGKYGSATDAALRQVLGSGFTASPTLCAAGVAPAPVVVPPPPAPVTPVNTTVTVTPATSSNTGLIIGGLLVAAVAVGGIAYATKKKPGLALPKNTRTRRNVRRAYR